MAKASCTNAEQRHKEYTLTYERMPAVLLNTQRVREEKHAMLLTPAKKDKIKTLGLTKCRSIFKYV